MYVAVFSKVGRFARLNTLKYQSVRGCSQKNQDEPPIPNNPLKDVYSANSQIDNGKIYDYKPFRIRCEAGKTYTWCLCGYSKSQPFCDGMHKNIFMKIKLRPVRFMVEETKDYWLCNCKQTSNRPFCDGTHLGLEVPYKVKT